jgi:outer membrane protein assembly factor BamB
MLSLQLAMATSLLCAAANADDWPMARHDARNTSYTEEELAPPLRLCWRVRSSGDSDYPVSGEMLASAGMICAVAGPEAYQRQQHTLLFDTSGRLIRRIENAVPVYLKQARLILASWGDPPAITCYDLKTWEAKWSHPLPGLIYFGGGVECKGVLYSAYSREPPGGVAGVAPLSRQWVFVALRIEDGGSLSESVWPYGSGAVACDGEHFYFGLDHWLHVLDAQTLKPQWGYYDGGNVDPILTGSFAVTQGFAMSAQAINLEKRKRVWGLNAYRGSAHSLAKGPGGIALVVESVSGALVGIRVDTGEIVWRHPLIVGGYGYPVTTAGSGRFVYAPGGHEHLPGGRKPRGGFYCLDAATGALRWKYERVHFGGRAVIVSEGCLYGVGSDGHLYKFVHRA